MFIFVKYRKNDNDENIVTAVQCSSKDLNNSGWIKLNPNNITPGGNIQIDNGLPSPETIIYQSFYRYCTQFKINLSNNTVSFRSGCNLNNFTDRDDLSQNIPLALTRANTIVNFGRL